MSELFELAIVEKRNLLNEIRSNNMTLQELRFFSIYLSKIDPYNIDTRCVKFPLEDFRKIMGFGKLNVGQLQTSTDNLLCKIVHLPDPDKKGILKFQLFKECHIYLEDDGKWYVEIDAHDKALPLMFDFKKEYFCYKLWNALRLKSANQIRMYEILKQYQSIGKRELTVTELRTLLGINENEYSGRTGWSDFKRKVLDSCQQALQRYTDICYEYKRGATGKGGKWLSIIFEIKANEDYKDPLSLNDFIAELPDLDENSMAEANVGPDDLFQTELPESQDDEENNICNEDSAIEKYGFKYLADLADACDYEFSKEEMRVLFDRIKGVFKDNRERYNFLREKYNILKLSASKRKVSKRYGYLLKLIDKDIADMQ